jgi:two-component system, NarL family, nitrate/nitrite response regulator NarL
VLHTNDAFLSSPEIRPRVLVVGPDSLARAGLAAILADDAGYTLVGQVAADPGLGDSVDGSAPDVIVWDLGRDPIRELEQVAELRRPGPPVVALVDDETVVHDALAAGVRGLLPRDATAFMLAASIRAAAHGLVVLDPELAPGAWRPREALAPSDAGLRQAQPEELTAREFEVLQLLAEGLPNKTIAHRLHISEHTAKYHVNAILGKLGAQTRTEAVARAARLGLVVF